MGTTDTPWANAEDIKLLRLPDDPAGGDPGEPDADTAFFDFDEIIRRAADRFEREHPEIVVPDAARRLLADRAHERESDVLAAVKRDGLTSVDLENAAFAQFEEALAERHDFTGRAAGARASLDAGAVLAGIAQKCWFVGWC
jgi:hypothetical protein